jgi:hypothetical protein
MSDAQIANRLVNPYAGPDGFAFYEPGTGDSGICWALQKFPDEYVFILRGSKTLEDWLRDLVAVPTFEHSLFGRYIRAF